MPTAGDAARASRFGARLQTDTGEMQMLSMLLAITYLALALFALTYRAAAPRRVRTDRGRDDARGGRR